jgi:hypothetical protein
LVELPPEFYTGNANDDDNVEADPTNSPEEGSRRNDNEANSHDIVIKVGTNSEVRVRRAKVNVMAFKDVIAEGTRRLEEKNLGVVRYRGVLRESRKRKYADHIYDSVKELQHDDGIDSSPIITRQMLKLKRMKWNV